MFVFLPSNIAVYAIHVKTWNNEEILNTVIDGLMSQKCSYSYFISFSHHFKTGTHEYILLFWLQVNVLPPEFVVVVMYCRHHYRFINVCPYWPISNNISLKQNSVKCFECIIGHLHLHNLPYTIWDIGLDPVADPGFEGVGGGEGVENQWKCCRLKWKSLFSVFWPYSY